MKIRWTKRAETSFEETIKYVEKEWGRKSAERVIRKITNFLKILTEHPKAGKVVIEDKQIRSLVISRYNTVIYRIKNNYIVLLKIIDNRQRRRN